MMSKPSCGFLLPLLLLAGSRPALAVDIDGRVSDSEWQGAQHVTDFRKTQPLNGEPATLATEAWILATPEGLAVAFRNTQPPSVPRTQQRVQRDFEEQVDRVNLMVDFDGDHRTGYDFTCQFYRRHLRWRHHQRVRIQLGLGWQLAHAVGSDEERWTVEC